MTTEERIKSLSKMIGIAECFSDSDKNYIDGFLVGYAEAVKRKEENNKVA